MFDEVFDLIRATTRLGSDATLINGLGRSPGTPTADLAVIEVTHGKRCVYLTDVSHTMSNGRS